METLFDSWNEKYDSWFATPAGQFVEKYESDLLLELLSPHAGERILDVGCGTGIFTEYVTRSGAEVIGVDISVPMLEKAVDRLESTQFLGVCGDMYTLPFPDEFFDKTLSMTAIEFVPDAGKVIKELDRVTKKGGPIVVTTLNSLSPWANQRRKKAEDGHTLFQEIHFRSPAEMRSIVPDGSTVKTAIHFQKKDSVDLIPEIELLGRQNFAETGAFVAVQWYKS